MLKSITMIFNGHYFHQIKGTTMGAPIAVSYANIFMSLLLEYQNKYNCKPTSWLSFIDIFLFGQVMGNL